MAIDLNEAGEKLEVICTGRYGQAELLAAIDAIADARARNPEIRKCIMDGLNADIQLGGIGEFFVGEYAAKRLSGMRVSLLAPLGQLSKLLENAAYNRGLKLLLTSGREEAEAWLLQ